MRHLPVLIFMLSMLAQATQGWADNLEGTVRDSEGAPIVGARINISTAAPKSGPSMFCPSCYLDCAKSTNSDEQGRFVFEGLDPTLKFRLLATAPNMQTAMTDLLDPALDSASITLTSFPADTPEDRVLQGKVVSSEGIPISGALVEPSGAKTAEQRWGGGAVGTAAVTDDDGCFRMLLKQDFDAIDVLVTAYGYPGAIAKLLRPGEESNTIAVSTGTSVTGQLTFRGLPSGNQSIAVVQVNVGRSDRIFIKAVMTTTDHDGRFIFNALPADESYAIFTPVGSGVTGPVLTTTLFKAAADGATRDLGKLPLFPGLTLAGHFRSTDETEIQGGIRMALGRIPAYFDLIEVDVDADGSFRIENLPPETYKISFRGENFVLDERQCTYQVLGRTSIGIRITDPRTDVEIPIRRQQEADTPSPSQYRQSDETSGNQTLSGQVVSRNNSSVGGIEISPRFLNGGLIQGKETKSDTQGRFTIRNLPDEPIALWFFDQSAYGYPYGITNQGTEGQMVLYPGEVCPQQNQSDIRVVFDPELTTPPMDLQ